MYPFRLDSAQGIRLLHTIGGESYRNNIVDTQYIIYSI